MNPLLTSIATEVAQETGSRLSAILAPTRGSPKDAWARALAMRLYKDLAPGSTPTLTVLGQVFGRDRTTVRHALERVHYARISDPGVDFMLIELKDRIAKRQ